MRFYVRSSFLQKLFKYGLIFFFLIMLETVTIPLTREGAVIPDLLLCGVIAVGIGEDERTAGICGLVSGFFLDALGGSGLAISPLIYAFCGYLAGVFARFFLRRNFLSYMIYVACGAAARSVITLAMVYGGQGAVPLNLALRDIILPEYFLTVLVSPLLYLIIALPLERKNKQSLKN